MKHKIALLFALVSFNSVKPIRPVDDAAALNYEMPPGKGTWQLTETSGRVALLKDGSIVTRTVVSTAWEIVRRKQKEHLNSKGGVVVAGERNKRLWVQCQGRWTLVKPEDTEKLLGLGYEGDVVDYDRALFLSGLSFRGKAPRS